MAPPAPWSQSLSVRWRPALTFYRRHIEILEQLDDAKVLRAFRVGDDQIDVRILTGHQMSVGQNGLSLEIFRQDADTDEVWRYVKMATDMIEPAQLGGVITTFQHLVPLEVSFEEAVRYARDSFLSPPAGEEVVDWAVLVNLQGADRSAPNLGPSVEWGVISQQEALPRLMRNVGRLHHSPIGNAFPGSPWDGLDMPAVALFADSGWPQDPGANFENMDTVRSHLDATRERACVFAGRLYEKIAILR